jgi:hypothetical protein
MKLTPKNYYTNKNRYISNSKISDWLKDKNYFYRKHMLGTVDQEPTDALIIGKAVDIWLTGSRKKFEGEFIGVKRRGGDIPKGTTELTLTQYDEVVALCEAVEATTVYKEIRSDKGFKSQVIMQLDYKAGLFNGYCGIPDFIKVDGDTCTIIDLKTTRDISPEKYYRHCLEYGYFRQQAMYQMLAQHNFGCTKFESYHLVVEKDADGIHHITYYLLKQSEVDINGKILTQCLEDIAKEKEFNKPDVAMKDALELGVW